MSLNKIVAGAFGYDMILTFKDTDTDAAEDLSGFSGKYIDIRAPDWSVNSITGSWVTDGSDGLVSATVPSGAIPESWSGKTIAARIKVTSGTAAIYSEWEEFELL